MLPVLAGAAGRGIASAAAQGAARGGASAIAGELVQSFVGGGGGRGGGSDVVERVPPARGGMLALPPPPIDGDPIEGELMSRDDQQIVKVDPGSSDIVSSIEKLPNMELSTHDSAAVRLLEDIRDNTADTADAVRDLSEMQEQAQELTPAAQGPEDIITDPNKSTTTDSSPKKVDGPFMKALKGLFKKLSLGLIAAGAIVMSLLGPGGVGVFQKLKEAFETIKEALTPLIVKFVNDIFPKLQELFGHLITGFAGLIENVIAPAIDFALPLITSAVGFIVDLIGAVAKFLTDPIGYIQDGIAMTANWVDGIIVKVADFFNSILNGIADIIENIPFMGDASKRLRESATLGSSARERIDRREGEMAEREAARQLDAMDEIDFESPPNEFFNAVQQKVSSGEIQPDVGQAMINAYNQEQETRAREQGGEAATIGAQLEPPPPAPVTEPEAVETPRERRQRVRQENIKQRDDLNSAIEKGIYSKNMIGDSDIDYPRLPEATDDELKAIVKDGDLSDEDMRSVQAELMSREREASMEAPSETSGQASAVAGATGAERQAQEEAQGGGGNMVNVAAPSVSTNSTNVSNSRTVVLPPNNSLSVGGRGPLPFGAQ